MGRPYCNNGNSSPEWKGNGWYRFTDNAGPEPQRRLIRDDVIADTSTAIAAVLGLRLGVGVAFVAAGFGFGDHDGSILVITMGRSRRP